MCPRRGHDDSSGATFKPHGRQPEERRLVTGGAASQRPKPRARAAPALSLLLRTKETWAPHRVSGAAGGDTGDPCCGALRPACPASPCPLRSGIRLPGRDGGVEGLATRTFCPRPLHYRRMSLGLLSQGTGPRSYPGWHRHFCGANELPLEAERCLP